MRALLIIRPDSGRRLGGDVILARQTAVSLAPIGVDADVVATSSPDARGYDIAHIFGIFEPEVCAAQVEACKHARVPIALSPIWADRREFFARAPHVERILAGRRHDKVAASLASLRMRPADQLLGRRERGQLERRERLQGELVRSADVLLPNALLTARDCAVRFGAANIPFVVVLVAAEHHASAVWPAQRSGVICVARVESLKNQAMLAFALGDDDILVTLVGEAYDARYLSFCRRWGRDRIRVSGQLPDEQVRSLLAQAAVHALPSWGDLPGIASLEAAAAGARIVVSDRGAEMEYFEEHADYADPADPDSIRTAVARALSRPPRQPGDDLDRRLRSLTWRRAAERTRRGYEIALERHTSV